MAKTQTVLKTDTMTMRFGGVTAVFQLNLDIREHQIEIGRASCRERV